MIGINKTKINGLPVLIVTKTEHVNKSLPTLVYYHGFRSGMENNLTIAYLLAEQGYRVILPECKYHGERLYNVTHEERDLAFWDIVICSIDELELIKQYLEERNLILNNRVGVAGTSMGGMITAGALTVYPWIKAGGLLMSSGNLQSFAHILIEQYNKVNDHKISKNEKMRVLDTLEPYDLSKNISKLNNRPLFLWHGKDDDVVPFSHAEDMMDKIKKSNQNMNHVEFIKEDNRGHHLSRLAIKELIKYCSRHL